MEYGMDDDQQLRGKPLGTEALDTMVLLSSYLPTLFGIVSLATAHDKTGSGEFKDEKGVMGGLSGVLCLGYAMFFCFGVATRQPDLCKVIMMARLSLGVLFVIGGAFLAVKSDLPRAVIFFCYAAFALPEAYLLYTYGAALQRDSDMQNPELANAMQLSTMPQMPMSQQQQLPPSQQGAPFMQHQQSYDQQGPPPMSDGGFGLAPVQGGGGGGYGGPPPGPYYG